MKFESSQELIQFVGNIRDNVNGVHVFLAEKELWRDYIKDFEILNQLLETLPSQELRQLCILHLLLNFSDSLLKKNITEVNFSKVITATSNYLKAAEIQKIKETAWQDSAYSLPMLFSISECEDLLFKLSGTRNFYQEKFIDRCQRNDDSAITMAVAIFLKNINNHFFDDTQREFYDKRLVEVLNNLINNRTHDFLKILLSLSRTTILLLDKFLKSPPPSSSGIKNIYKKIEDMLYPTKLTPYLESHHEHYSSDIFYLSWLANGFKIHLEPFKKIFGLTKEYEKSFLIDRMLTPGLLFCYIVKRNYANEVAEFLFLHNSSEFTRIMKIKLSDPVFVGEMLCEVFYLISALGKNISFDNRDYLEKIKNFFNQMVPSAMQHEKLEKYLQIIFVNLMDIVSYAIYSQSMQALRLPIKLQDKVFFENKQKEMISVIASDTDFRSAGAEIFKNVIKFIIKQRYFNQFIDEFGMQLKQLAGIDKVAKLKGLCIDTIVKNWSVLNKDALKVPQACREEINDHITHENSLKRSP